MSAGRWHWLYFVIMLTLAGSLHFGRLGLPLLEPEEARYAEIPRQMILDGHWLVPHRDGQPYLDKPPLLYWLVMLSYSTLGVSETTARLPNAVAAWLTIVVVYFWGRRIADPDLGLAAATVLTLAGDFAYRASMLNPNGLLALMTTTALAAGYFALQADRFRWSWWGLSALACGLGVLTKGPLALVLVAGPLLIWQLLAWQPVRWRAWLAYICGISLVAGPWFIAVSVVEPSFLTYFFGKHHVERFVRPFDHAKPWWFYLPGLFLGFSPAIFAMARLHRHAREMALPLLAAGWALLIFSMCGSKRPGYIVPLEPPLALALGAVWVMWAKVYPHRVLVATVGTAMILLAGAFLWLPQTCEMHSVRSAVDQSPRERYEQLPIYASGHGWDGIGFLLKSSVVTIPDTQRDRLFAELLSHERSVLCLPAAARGEVVLRELPEQLRFELLASNRLVRIGLVVRQATHSPTGFQ